MFATAATGTSVDPTPTRQRSGHLPARIFVADNCLVGIEPIVAELGPFQIEALKCCRLVSDQLADRDQSNNPFFASKTPSTTFAQAQLIRGAAAPKATIAAPVAKKTMVNENFAIGMKGMDVA